MEIVYNFLWPKPFGGTVRPSRFEFPPNICACTFFLSNYSLSDQFSPSITWHMYAETLAISRYRLCTCSYILSRRQISNSSFQTHIHPSSIIFLTFLHPSTFVYSHLHSKNQLNCYQHFLPLDNNFFICTKIFILFVLLIKINAQ